MPTPPIRSQAMTAVAAAASVVGFLGTLYYLDIPSMVQQRTKSRKVDARCYSTGQQDKPSLAAFRILTQQVTLKETYPLAQTITKNIPVYDCTTFRLDDEAWVDRLQDELYHILLNGPGVYVVKHFFTDLGTIDAANTAYDRIIAHELAETDGAKGDHFAPASANSRIWNSFSKLCLEDPESFVTYHSNPLFRVVCEAYLGPAYRLTSQVNIVKPGGQPQACHRDYHIGFETPEATAKWPKAMHTASQLLTLQGAVAHTDMPVESGPTRLLPFSQLFEEGFMAYRLPEFNDYFLESYVSLPLEKGDAIFFSPALFHAAGQNSTDDFARSANLIQVSSAFGKPMETIDTIPLVDACWEHMMAKYEAEGMSAEVDALVRAVGEGYPFPTNLDRRPPAPGGMAPESEQNVLRRALGEGWDRERIVGELKAMSQAAAA
ncbi:hypothetical protein LTR85_000666 [Meristemomyces frigidus]|nr:hypothetical protein LTR85_000666 [Meristemomyces frigidus]